MALPPDRGWTSGPNRLATEIRHKSRFRRKNDIGKPVRPVTAYDVFFRNTYPWLREKRADLNQQQLFSEVGRLWREGSTWQDRQVCYDFADWEKHVYDVAMKDWKIRREIQKQRASPIVNRTKIGTMNPAADLEEENSDAIQYGYDKEQCKQQ